MKIKLEYGKSKYFIESDNNQFIVHEGWRKSGDIRSRINPSYFLEFAPMVSYILNNTLRKSDAETLDELLKDFREIQNLILKKFDLKRSI